MIPDKNLRYLWGEKAVTAAQCDLNEYCPIEFLDLLDAIDELEAENATLREQNSGHVERIAAQKELLEKKSEKPFDGNTPLFSPIAGRRTWLKEQGET